MHCSNPFRVISSQASAKIQDLQIKLTNAEDEVRSLHLKHEFEIEVEKKAKKCLKQEKESLENDLHISKQEVMALKSTVAKMTADSLGITTELQATKVSLALPDRRLSRYYTFALLRKKNA